MISWILVFISSGVYAVLRSHVTCFYLLKAKGQRFECPLLFLKFPLIYDMFTLVLFWTITLLCYYYVEPMLALLPWLLSVTFVPQRAITLYNKHIDDQNKEMIELGQKMHRSPEKIQIFLDGAKDLYIGKRK